MNTTTQIEWTKVNHDVNGNPRYVCHFLKLLTQEEKNSDIDISKKYEIALKRAKKIGGRKFHNKQYGGGIVFQTYNTNEIDKLINDLLNTQPTKLSGTFKKYADIINSGTIEEGQIIRMRSFMHKDKENAKFIFSLLNGKPLLLTPIQISKGYYFLLSQWKTPAGIERKNNPFGYREERILANFSTIELKSLYNNGNAHHDNYLPLYEVSSKDGDSFEYYYDGEINIVG